MVVMEHENVGICEEKKITKKIRNEQSTTERICTYVQTMKETILTK